MRLQAAEDTESRFVAYVEGLTSMIGHADREGPLRDYCTGLVMPCERKSVEPMAAVTAPARDGAQHQSLLHLVGEGGLVGRERYWLKYARWCCRLSSAIGRSRRGSSTTQPSQSKGGIRLAWRDNTAVNSASRIIVRSRCTLSIANHDASLPVAYQLYLPKDWAKDRARRRKTGVPKEIKFKTKPQIGSNSCVGRVQPVFLAASR